MSQSGLGLNKSEYLHVLHQTGPFCVMEDERKLFEQLLPSAVQQPDCMNIGDHQTQALDDLRTAGIPLFEVLQAVYLERDTKGFTNLSERQWLNETATVMMLRFLARKCFMAGSDEEYATSKVGVDLISRNIPPQVMDKVLCNWRKSGEGRLAKIVLANLS